MSWNEGEIEDEDAKTIDPCRGGCDCAWCKWLRLQHADHEARECESEVVQRGDAVTTPQRSIEQPDGVGQARWHPGAGGFWQNRRSTIAVAERHKPGAARRRWRPHARTKAGGD